MENIELKNLLKEAKTNIEKVGVDSDRPLRFGFGDPHNLGIFGASEDGVSVEQADQWDGYVFSENQLQKEGVFSRILSRIKRNKRDIV